MALTSWTVGLLFIGVVTIIWSFSSLLTQYIYADLNFQSPFILTYVSSSFFVVYIPIWYLCVLLKWAKDIPLWRKVRKGVPSPIIDSQSFPSTPDRSLSSPDFSPRSVDGIIPQTEIAVEGRPQEDTVWSPFRFVMDRVSSSTSSSMYQTLASDQTATVLLQRHPLTRLRSAVMNSIPNDYSHVDVFTAALVLSPLWFFGNILYNYSLLLTSITNSTVISNTSGVFTLLFSCLCGIETVTAGKFFGLVLCIGGVALVSFQDEEGGGRVDDASAAEDTAHSAVGDIVAILGAVCYGLYSTILKLKVPEDDAALMQLLFGYIGLCTAVLLSPVLFFMLFTGAINNFTLFVLACILFSSLFDDVVADYLWARSVVLTSPTVATVGLSMTIPLAIFSDLLRAQLEPPGTVKPVGWSSVFGALMVLVGFVLVNIDYDLPVGIGYCCCAALIRSSAIGDATTSPIATTEFRSQRTHTEGSTSTTLTLTKPSNWSEHGKHQDDEEGRASAIHIIRSDDNDIDTAII